MEDFGGLSPPRSNVKLLNIFPVFSTLLLISKLSQYLFIMPGIVTSRRNDAVWNINTTEKFNRLELRFYKTFLRRVGTMPILYCTDCHFLQWWNDFEHI